MSRSWPWPCARASTAVAPCPRARPPHRSSSCLAQVRSDLEEIETACRLLKVPGWHEGDAAERPPVVRRNLLLLEFYLHQDQLGAVMFAPSTRAAVAQTVNKAWNLLEFLFNHALNARWVKVALSSTSLKAMLVNGLWDSEDDECRELQKAKLFINYNHRYLNYNQKTMSAASCRRQRRHLTPPLYPTTAAPHPPTLPHNSFPHTPAFRTHPAAPPMLTSVPSPPVRTGAAVSSWPQAPTAVGARGTCDAVPSTSPTAPNQPHRCAARRATSTRARGW